MLERNMFDRNPTRANLRTVAKRVVDRWATTIGGEYSPPPCPDANALATLLELANYAASIPEEGRLPKFNILVAPAGEKIGRDWRFSEVRALSVAELRRILPTTDSNKSALLVEWNEEAMRIAGLVDLGTSWRRARLGLSLRYEAPHALVIEIERPNRLSIYQGQFRLATYSDGELDLPFGIDPPFFLHEPAREGLNAISTRFARPRLESPREYLEAEFVAMWNCFAALANTIGISGHGGTLVLVPNTSCLKDLVKIKYSLPSSRLSDDFVEFINARHKCADRYEALDAGKRVSEGQLAKVREEWHGRFEDLVESVRLVAKFAACDGAIILTSSLETIGFGCELKAPLAPGWEVSRAGGIGKKTEALDVEQFGMRHRSALKFVSQCSTAVVLVVSQDGPISGVWAEQSNVMVRTETRLVSANVPWA